MVKENMTNTMPADRVIVVTGGNKGIGYCIVRRLLQQSSEDTVVYLTCRDHDRGNEAIRCLQAEGLRPQFHLLDIACMQSICQLKAHLLERYGGLDVLVNNAGFAFKFDAMEPVGEQAKETIRVNYFGTLTMCKELMPLVRRGGRVVNVGSMAGSVHSWGTRLKRRITSADLTEQELTDLMMEFVTDANFDPKGLRNKGWPGTTCTHNIY